MGSAVAIELARRGFDATLIDQEAAPVAATSRWNEGKIHLGYLYGGDPTLATARHIIPGGLRFAERARELIGDDLDGHTTTTDDVYLIHRDSVASPAQLRERFAAISELIREHPDAARYLVDVSDARATELGSDELHALSGMDIVAGFRVPERSVDTRWFADRLAGAAASEPGVELRMGTRVTAAEPVEAVDGRWRVRGADGYEEQYDLVVNALWGGRISVDVTAGLTPEPPWTHRYRWCVFVRTSRELDVPSAIVATGPFGDVKNYNGRDFYLSWYPIGLRAESAGLELAAPPLPSGADADAFVERVRAALQRVMPWTAEVFDDAESTIVHGGFVFARGAGALDDPGSGLHRRDRYGVARRGAYFSIDTGKFSTAPWLARALADEIAGISGVAG